MQIGDMAEAAPRVCLNKAKFNFGDVAGVLKFAPCAAQTCFLITVDACVEAAVRAARLLLLQALAKEGPERRE